MNEKRNCKIIQDLLPNYIENLTNEETNNYIEEHLKECTQCKMILENMQKDLKVDNMKKEKGKVKYLKKYHNKLKTLRIILLIILIIFLANTIRKMMIISSLDYKAQNYENSNNYHLTRYSYNKSGYGKSELYRLGDKQKLVTTRLEETGNTFMQIYINEPIENYNKEITDGKDYSSHIYIEKDGIKNVQLNAKVSVGEETIENQMHTHNICHLFLAAITSTVKSKNYDGKPCYLVSNYKTLSMLSSEEVYIDKETGLVRGRILVLDGIDTTVHYTIEQEYEFDTVTELDFVEPNRNDYEEIFELPK